MSKEVTILGRGLSRLSAPLSGEVWGLNGGYKYCKSLDRIFAMHVPEIHDGSIDAGGSLEEMKDLNLTIVDLSTYPLAEILEEFGAAYFLNSISYMIALAIHEDFEKINIIGVDYIDQDEQRDLERTNTEFWIGVAIGKGIHVNITNGSSLMTPAKGHSRFYGYLDHNKKPENVLN